jgi:cytoskeletal protein CcmA (bactofilin family)
MEKLVNIGQSVQIKGELAGNEDLTIEGKVEGKVFLKDHNLTIGGNGRIAAEIHAKTVMVIGEVVGNITADDKVEIAATGSMRGDIVAPRVVLADGARFKGSIDMDKKSAAAAHAARPAAAAEVAATAMSAKGSAGA